jgi:hypothetical protein
VVKDTEAFEKSVVTYASKGALRRLGKEKQFKPDKVLIWNDEQRRLETVVNHRAWIISRDGQRPLQRPRSWKFSRCHPLLHLGKFLASKIPQRDPRVSLHSYREDGRRGTKGSITYNLSWLAEHLSISPLYHPLSHTLSDALPVHFLHRLTQLITTLTF